MARGGARPGAGRKKGTANKRTRDIADQAAADGLTPLEVMLKAMRAADAEGNAREAAQYAQMAAPYIHPRLASVQSNATVQGSLAIVSEFPSA